MVQRHEDERNGRLILAATPLGDRADASERLRLALSECQVIAAEDTRRLRRLAADLGVVMTGRVVSMHDSVEAQRIDALLAALREGRDVLVVSDAGMPAINDPGYRLVRAVIDAGLVVTVLPGPSAVVAALVVSGLPVDRFCFEGFLPRKGAERTRRLADLKDERRTMVLFEAPHRIEAMLTDCVTVFGADRPGALCRELTKTYEEVIRGSLGEILARVTEDGVRGEITMVIGGASVPHRVGVPADWADQVAARVAAGESKKEAMGEVAREVGVPRREVYDAVVAAGKTPPPP